MRPTSRARKLKFLVESLVMLDGNAMVKTESTAPAATMTVGDLVAHWLAEIGITTVFGVISIHNMPILDAIHRQGRIRFVSARGEAGAMNMADAYARVTQSLGVVFTSTGTAAGNAAGSQVEALTACSAVLHITTQIDRPFADRDRAAIHDVPRQPEMLRGVSKAVYRAWEPHNTLTTLAAAASAAISAPCGPVSVEIPVDVQRQTALQPQVISPLRPVIVEPCPQMLDALAALVLKARRPMLWLGGGARRAGREATDLVERGFAVVTSTNGRAIVAEDHPASLGAFNMTPQAQKIYADCDLMLVVGSRLRGNETLNNAMRLGSPLVQIDADASQGARNYPVDLFLHGDAVLALRGLLARLPGKLSTDPALSEEIQAARQGSEAQLQTNLGPYKKIADVLRQRVGGDGHPFVRDVTISNSTFGNRYVTLAQPHLGVHALGGGIGQGCAMAIGAAMASGLPKTIALMGDGGSMVALGEFATAVEEEANIVFLLMNDRGYGVIRNIQDAQYEGRQCYTLKVIPDFGLLAQSLGLRHQLVAHTDEFENALNEALSVPGPVMLEIDMVKIGPFTQAFSGPPAGAAGSAR